MRWRFMKVGVLCCAFFALDAVCKNAWTQPATIKILHFFNGTDGTSPKQLVPASDGNFYGTTYLGGANGSTNGTFFRMTPDGTFTSLFTFNNTNGSQPAAHTLTLGPDGQFFGTTTLGGTNGGFGTIFKVTTNGDLTSLFSFNDTNGQEPFDALTLLDDGNFYGTAILGGTNGGFGTIFKITPDGTLTSLAAFSGTNGARPASCGLVQGLDGDLYGTTILDGTNGFNDIGHTNGTFFRVTTNGDFTSLMTFAGANGSQPTAVISLAPDGSFYGSTTFGGAFNRGTLYRITTNGELTTLVHFNGTNGWNPSAAGLTLGFDGNYYGTTLAGGTNGSFGTVFKMTTNGQLTTLFSFGLTNGWEPNSLTLTSDGRFYGTTFLGGTNNNGVIFVLTYQPHINNVARSANGVTLQVESPAKSTNRVWTSSDLALSLNQWQVISTNIADANGLFQFSDTNLSGYPTKFYRVSTP